MVRILLRGRCFFILLSLFYIHFSSAGAGDILGGMNPGMIGQVLGSLTQVMGQAEAKCGTEYSDVRPTNDDFCAELNSELTFALGEDCPAEISNAIPAPPPPPKCWKSVTSDFMQSVDEDKVGQTLKNGNQVCHCCMVPSICLLGGVGRIVDLLRVGNYAGLLMGLNNNKICGAIEKTQHASAALDAMSGGKCIRKGRNCRRTHSTCVEELEDLIQKIEEGVTACKTRTPSPGFSYPDVDCTAEINQLNEHIKELESSSNQKCGAASQAGQSQLVQAAVTGVASLVARDCKKDYESKTKCDDKKDEELDRCCEEHPGADACKQDSCEGQEGEDLDRCCSANPRSALCITRETPGRACHPMQLTNDPNACREQCKEDPTLPGCKNFCNLYWDKDICKEVCKTYQMPKCDREGERKNSCDDNPDQACCVDSQSPGCHQFCQDNPESVYCQCSSNPGRCSCDREEDRVYMQEGQCSVDLSSEECEDPDDPACQVENPENKNIFSEGDDDGGNTTDSPWTDASPFLDTGEVDPNDGAAPSGASRYSASPGGGGGGGLGGGLGGGSGGGGGGGEEEGPGGDEADPYENILAGLSGDQNQAQGSGGGGRGSRAGRSGSGFDLKKFLPKKKKSKKAKTKKAGKRAPSSVDSIFDISSQMIGRYCTNNNMNCVSQ